MSKVSVILAFMVVAAVVCTSAVAPAGAAMVDFPAGAGAQRVRAFVSAFNSGDDATMSAYYQANFTASALAARPAADRLQMYHTMLADMRSIEPVRLLVATDDRVDMLVTTASGDHVTFDFHFDSSPARLVASLTVEFGTTDEPPQQQPKQGADLTDAIASLLADESKADRFSGVVLLAKDKDILFQRAYGDASKAYGVPNSLDMRFNLGSIDKLVTKVAIEQLVEAHKLRYDQTLGSVLTDYPNRNAAQEVTVRELVDMTSGIGDFFGPKFAASPKDSIRGLRDYLPFFANEPLAFAPGTRMAYSNGGYIVLGLIIQKVSGQSYYDYVHDHIFATAGMTRSGWFERDVPTPDVATGYTKREDDQGAQAAGWRDNVYTAPARGSSAGGGQATASDLLAFALALEHGRLLDAVGTAAIAGGPIGVAGGAPGINATLDMDPGSGYILVVLSNYDPPSAERIAQKIRAWLGK